MLLQASMNEPGPSGAGSPCSGNITVTTADVAAAADVVPGYTLEGMVGEGGFCQVCGRHMQRAACRAGLTCRVLPCYEQSHL